MNLKNYTSGVSVSKTISQIETKLVEIGATNILKNYHKGKVMSLAFEIPVNDIMLPVKLPVKTNEVLKYFEKNRPKGITHSKYPEQVERTAWKTVLVWIKLQIQMILLGQAKFEEVFMPYIWVASKKQTLFENTKSNVLLLVGPKTPAPR